MTVKTSVLGFVMLRSLVNANWCFVWSFQLHQQVNLHRCSLLTNIRCGGTCSAGTLFSGAPWVYLKISEHWFTPKSNGIYRTLSKLWMNVTLPHLILRRSSAPWVNFFPSLLLLANVTQSSNWLHNMLVLDEVCNTRFMILYHVCRAGLCPWDNRGKANSWRPLPGK
jgi:hypothetical protein